MKITFLNTTFFKIRHIILYGILMAILVFILKWLQWKFLIVNNSIDIYIGLIAIFFTVLGVWMATQFIRVKTKTVIVEKKVIVTHSDKFKPDDAELKNLNLSSREYEVLQLLAKGYSNADIAKKLFLSINTIKTHVSNLYQKVDVKSRTQVIEKAKRMKIIE